MKAKLWQVKYGHWSSINVNARNINEAISKALRADYHKKPKMSEITEVELIAEED